MLLNLIHLIRNILQLTLRNILQLNHIRRIIKSHSVQFHMCDQITICSERHECHNLLGIEPWMAYWMGRKCDLQRLHLIHILISINTHTHKYKSKFKLHLIVINLRLHGGGANDNFEQCVNGILARDCNNIRTGISCAKLTGAFKGMEYCVQDVFIGSIRWWSHTRCTYLNWN